MRIKRVLQGTVLTALAAVTLAGVGKADAAEVAGEFPFEENVWFSLGDVNSDSWGDASVYINAPDEKTKEIMVGIASYNKNKKTVKIADNAWSVYDVDVAEGGVNVDLSKLSPTKDNYIAIRSESTKPVYFRIGASITKQKYEYNAATHAISFKTFTASENAKDLKEDNTTLMYRTQGGGWQSMDNGYWDDNTKTWESWGNNNIYTHTSATEKTFNKNNVVFQEYQYQGATLYLRVAGIVNDLSEKAADYKLDDVEDANDKSTTKAKYNLYNAGYMPSKEVKLNIAKQANGPSVSADYVNGKVKIPAKTEYRVIASGGAMSADGTTEKPYTKNSSSNSVEVTKLLEFAKEATSGTIEVRKEAVTTGKGKAPSKWTRVDIEVPEKIAVDGATQGDKKDITLTANSEISATAGAITLKDGIKIEVKTNNKGAVSGLSVTVPTTCKYGVNVYVDDKKTAIKNDGKAKTVKATADKAIKISKAGDKKGKTWASDSIDIGKTKN